MRATGWQYTEIAESLGISRIRVNQLLARADARLRELDQRGIIPRSARAARLRELEDDPPAYLVGAIGRPPRPSPKRGGERLRLEWRRLALAIEDFRTAQAVTDPIHALGPRSEPRGGERERLERAIDGYTRARDPGHRHER